MSSVSAADDRADVGGGRAPARTAGACARSGRRRRSPSWPRGSGRRPASGPPSRPGARCAAGPGRTSRTRRRAAAGSPRRGRRRWWRRRRATLSNVLRKSSVPVCLKMKNVPSTSPTSPTTLMTNALMPASRGRPAAVPERDQQVGRRADERPADDQQHEVARQDQQQHREDEEVQVGEEARVAAVGAHVGDRVEVDQRRDAGDDEHHEDRQRVDQDRELGVDAGGVRVVPRDERDLALGRRRGPGA